MSAAGDDSRFPTGLMILFVGAAIALVVVSVISLMGLVLVGDVTDGVGGDEENRTASPDPITGEFVSFDNTGTFEGSVLEILSVRDSTNLSVRLTGADDSFVQSQESFELAADDTWTMCTWASVDSDAATENMTALSADGRVLIQHNGSQGNWTAWYFDDGTRNSFRVNVSAPNQPGNLTHVCAWQNATHFGIQRNTTAGETVNTSAAASGSSITSVDVNSTNWDGRLDESRGFDEALNSSQFAALHGYGVMPLTNATRTFRMTYDEGSGTTTAIYFTDTSADISNFTWASGLNGSELDEGTDYRISEQNAQIRALEDGKIDGAPVVWINYRFEASDVSDLVPGIRGGFSLLAVATLALPAVAVLGGLMFIVVVVIRAGTGEFMDDVFGGRRGGGR